MMSDNSLKQVRYCDWDILRGMLYDVFGWYMENLSEIDRLSDLEVEEHDAFVMHCLKRGFKSYQHEYEDVKRGDEL